MNRSMSPSAVSASNDWLTWYTPALKLVVIIVMTPEISATILMTMNPRMVERIMRLSLLFAGSGRLGLHLFGLNPEHDPNTYTSVILGLYMVASQVSRA